jgi:hypothetical protein
MSDGAEVQKELTNLVNRLSLENASDTPDFIIAEFLHEILGAWNSAVQRREKWYGRRQAAETEDPDEEIREAAQRVQDNLDRLDAQVAIHSTTQELKRARIQLRNALTKRGE